MAPLSEKIAVVTGSSRGIGKAVACELAQRGASILVHYFRRKRCAEETAAGIERLGGRAAVFRAHLGQQRDIEALFQYAQQSLGGVDILVCNAASGVFRPMLEMNRQSWDWTMNISAQSLLWCAQQAVPMMEARGGGRIVNISSTGTQRILPLYSMVGVAKATLEAMTRYLAVELAPKGIIVNAVAPGAVPTSEWEVNPELKQDLELSVCRTPLGRFVSPEDIAKIVAFLSSFETDAIVGQTIVADGGYTLAW